MGDRDPSQDGADEPPAVRMFRRYLEDCRGDRPIAARTAFDPVAIPRLLPSVFLVDVLDGGADFRYRLIGGRIRERTPRNLTGLRLSEIADEGSQGALMRLYTAAVATGAAVAARLDYTSPELELPSHYDVLVAPLADVDGRIIQLVGIAVYAED